MHVMPGGFTQTPAELPDLDEPRDEVFEVREGFDENGCQVVQGWSLLRALWRRRASLCSSTVSCIDRCRRRIPTLLDEGGNTTVAVVLGALQRRSTSTISLDQVDAA